MTPTGQWPIVILYKKQTHVTGISLNCTFISRRNSNPNLKTASTLGLQLPSGQKVSVLVSKQESTVEREFSWYSYCRRVRKARVDCIYGCHAFRFRFYRVHPYIYIYRSILKQVIRFIPRPLRHIFKVKTSVHRSLFSNCMAFLDSGYISGHRDEWSRKIHH